MKAARFATSRQRACQNCSAAKARCDRKLRGCSRCALRGLPCTYPQVPPLGSSAHGASDNDVAASNSPLPVPQGPEMLDFSSLGLFSPINVDDISNRWLNSSVASPGKHAKENPATVAVHGRGVPPFVHSLQMTAISVKPQLSTCLSLVRICEKPLPSSENVAVDGAYDDLELLSAFQAYLIYSMVLFFRLGQFSHPFLRQAMTSLQDLARSSSRRGVMCAAEQHHARPRWEAWIVAEAKRRTLFVMYLFDSVLSAQDEFQTFLGAELRLLPAPSNKFLWRAETRKEWQTAYNSYLPDRVKEGLRIDELWPIPPDIDESSLLERRKRVDQWLEDVDEFGTLLYAVTSCTHGG
ncbi:hypothetical protein F5X99DRAFT_415994 [Biscogniauxia marginata]|nr:hypothetical protein F5X99DRAFT_415994 [Biscogniauxia marginata]